LWAGLLTTLANHAAFVLAALGCWKEKNQASVRNTAGLKNQHSQSQNQANENWKERKCWGKLGTAAKWKTYFIFPLARGEREKRTKAQEQHDKRAHHLSKKQQNQQTLTHV